MLDYEEFTRSRKYNIGSHITNSLGGLAAIALTVIGLDNIFNQEITDSFSKYGYLALGLTVTALSAHGVSLGINRWDA